MSNPVTSSAPEAESQRAEPATEVTAPDRRELVRHAVRRLLVWGHHGLALLGASAVLIGIALAVHPQWRQQALGASAPWVKQHYAVFWDGQEQDDAEAQDGDELPVQAGIASRPLATDVKSLSRQQAAVAYWIGSKYRVAPEAVGMLVQEAWAIGSRQQLDPSLLLAIVAIESRFNPFAQSHVGAQGLMQVMTRVHSDKYIPYGGQLAALDPISNMRVGAKVLKNTIARAGSLRGGLKYYVGAANLPDDQGYGDKVLAEYARIHAVAQGQTVASDADIPVPGKIGQFSTEAPVRIVRVDKAAHSDKAKSAVRADAVQNGGGKTETPDGIPAPDMAAEQKESAPAIALTESMQRVTKEQVTIPAVADAHTTAVEGDATAVVAANNT